ncbi:hypothetical protein [Nonomuraea sp. NPDC003201]
MWWIDADSSDLIRAGLAALARALACGIDSVAAERAIVEEAAAWALSRLAAHPGWLVIFDNVEDTADIEPYLARLSHGHVMITTRRATCVTPPSTWSCCPARPPSPCWLT